MSFARWTFFLACLLLVTGCTVSGFLVPRDYALHIAAQNQWHAVEFQGDKFVLQGFHGDFSSSADTLAVYLEGDGYAWRNRYLASSDPTPRNPVALRLAVQAPESKVLYLARPCQFTTDVTWMGCDPKYWTSHRYSATVIDAISEAIDRAKVLAGVERIILVGYSGGGVVATLLAAQRDDVAGLVTVAANLDIATWTAGQDVTPLTGSLNPVDFTARLKNTFQVHLGGERDDLVPPAVLRSYLAKLQDRSAVQWAILPGYDHHCCWVENWQTLYAKYVVDPK